jgi:hypothetical protein
LRERAVTAQRREGQNRRCSQEKMTPVDHRTPPSDIQNEREA